MTGGKLIMSCRAATSTTSSSTRTSRSRPSSGRMQAEPYAMTPSSASWGYMVGNFLQDVVVLRRGAASTRAAAATCSRTPTCSSSRDGRTAPAQRRQKTLVGDELPRDCAHALGVFPTMSHGNDYGGKIIGGR
ncbi:hypothetical protein ABZP36_029336 [Zizania latifolia]